MHPVRSFAGWSIFCAMTAVFLAPFGACRVNTDGLGQLGDDGKGGMPGLAGTTGAAGATPGIAGAPGTAGAPVSGSAGVAGLAGEPGTTGVAGAGLGEGGKGESTGEAGMVGATGEAGATGGEAGATSDPGGGAGGEAGPGGSQGAAGEGGGGRGGVTGRGGHSGFGRGGTNGDVCGGGCAPCFRCGATGCEPEPQATWTVVCQSATIAATKPNGTVWDPSQKGTAQNPDGVCELSIDIWSRSSTVVNDSLTPVWNANVTPTGASLSTTVLTSAMNRWTLTVLDQDTLGPNGTPETICTVSPHLTAADLANGSVTFSDVDSCHQLTIGVSCAMPAAGP
jgi:hypothetical protein